MAIPRPTRLPQPAHAHNLAAARFEYSPSHVDSRFHPIPMLSVGQGSSNGPTVALPTPMLPFPAIPFPGFPVVNPSQELHHINLLQTLQRNQQQQHQQQQQQQQQHQQTSAAPHKIKTPINRNYLELAMLVCNTFRGKLFPCPHCRYVTDRRNNLKRHISTMHQTCEKTLECCGVSFSTKASLREHIMIFHHNGYSCPYCGRRFCRKALLKRHLSVHSGQKDYTCPSCDYATSHKSNLERHKRIHERLKLGEDGSIFECGDFSTHQLTQSPDTTETMSCADESKDDSFIDIDSTDDNSDIDVTEETSSDNDILRHYPVIMHPKNQYYQKVGTLAETSQIRNQSEKNTTTNSFRQFEDQIPHSTNKNQVKGLPQSSAIDFSKPGNINKSSLKTCCTSSHYDTCSSTDSPK